MDLGDWLRSLGLERYEAAFRENAIDDTVLHDLTEDHLRQIGIPLGARLKLLKAIAALGARAEATSPSADVAPPDLLVNVAERRQVTVMFSDLVGSTALSARMDPEDLREVISAYHKCAAEIVRRFGGFVAQYLGDGVLIYFGYPQAHEDDAERSVRAGLELVAGVGGLKTRASLQTRVGIATGLVVVGDLVDAGGSQERGIVGETPNLAARLQGIAEPNMIVIAEDTRKLLGNLFELQDLGAKEIKGIAGSVRVWAALRASSVESRFDALHATGLTALVGREEESELLLRRWARAKNGEGQVVLLSGEAGIGKSRLTAALLESVAAEPHTRLRYFCSPQHPDSALYPIISQMERAAGLAHYDSPQGRLDKLDALLAQTSTSAQDAALFAEILSLANDGRYPAIELGPQQRRQRTLEALTAQMETLTRASPVLMIFEDAHWIDPTSLEALGRAVDQIRTVRVLLIVTFRPEFDPPWIGRPYVTALTINRLGQRDIDAMIDRVIGNKLLPSNIRQDIIERTDGIPLFVEEMTKAVLEAEGEGEARRIAAAVPSPAMTVPSSLHASLMARLDRLGGPAKEVAQIGAAIGREFSHALLAAVVRKPEAELDSALGRLVAGGLLFRQGVPPHASYLFKHALVQDAAYGTLLREPRRGLHARIAETLENQFPEIAENHPELLARHCTEAVLIEKAANLWGKAGHQSRTRSALIEAVAQLTKALGLIKTLPGTASRRRELINVQVALAVTLMHVKGYAAPETITAFADARSMIERTAFLHEELDDPMLRLSVLSGLWNAKFVAFDGDGAFKQATELMTLAEQAASPLALLTGSRVMGLTLVLLGQFEAARVQLERGISVFVPGGDDHWQFRFGTEPRLSLLIYHSWTMWFLGYPDTALIDVETVLRIARHLNEVSTLMLTLFHVCMPELLSGNVTAAETHEQELFSLAQEKLAPLWRAHAIIIRGRALSMKAQAADSVKLIETGLKDFESTGATHFKPFFLAELALAYGQCAEFGKATDCILEALNTVEKTKERWAEAEIYRVAGELSLGVRNTHDAEAQFTRAISVAREQHAKSWELRAATSLARLWKNEGRGREARDLLSGIYGWFTEGFDTRDLKNARALLDTLAA
jgi:class 3 adenylate cyclase/predicted ATPase